MAPHWIPISLILTSCFPCFLATLNSTTVSSELVDNASSTTPRVRNETSGGSAHTDPVMTGEQGKRGTVTPTNRPMFTSIMTMPRVRTSTVALSTSPVNGSLTLTSTSRTMTPRVTPTTTSTTTPTTTSTTTPELKNILHEMPDRTGTLVLLFLLLILLVICLYCAWKKLQEFGGWGSYYPCQMDKRLYVNPEEGEGRARGARPMGQAFMAAVRSYLPWKAGPQEEELEEDEEELEEGNPGDGESEGEVEGEEGEEADGGSSPGETDQSDSDDYSSLGGLDLRERAGRAEGGEEEDEGEEGKEGEEEDLSDPPSPSSEEFLSDLHSFSGTATWTDTKHDVTVL